MMNVDKIQFRPDGSQITPEQFGFNLVCEKCGNTRTRLIPTSHYNTGYETPDMITMHLTCTNCHNDIEYVIYKNNKFQVEWSQTIDSFNINGDHTFGYGITIEKFEDGTLVPNIHYNSPHEGGPLLSCEKNPSEQYRERFKNYFEMAVIEEGEYWNIASRMVLRKYNLEEYAGV